MFSPQRRILYVPKDQVVYQEINVFVPPRFKQQTDKVIIIPSATTSSNRPDTTTEGTTMKGNPHRLVLPCSHQGISKGPGLPSALLGGIQEPWEQLGERSKVPYERMRRVFRVSFTVSPTDLLVFSGCTKTKIRKIAQHQKGPTCFKRTLHVRLKFQLAKDTTNST